ncbi:alpha/beta fold hydrolase [Pseudomonas cerasi]
MVMLTRVHEGSNPKALNVIFVHGLGGDVRSTWMHNPNDHTTLWPCWIGEDVDCTVWVAGYGAALSGWTNAAMHLADQGEALFAALQAEPKLQKTQIVLVGHSLGGLVIKSGMTQAQALGDPRRETMLEYVAGVVFVGTPHQGSSLATVANNLRIALRTNPQVINMANDDTWLKLLNGQFRNLQTQRKFRVRVFFETKGVLLGRKVWIFELGKRLTIVDRNSSDPGIAGVTPTGIDGDHIEIAKPKSREELAHKALVEFLRDVAEPQPTCLIVAEPSVWPERGELTTRMRNASAPLLSWPSTLPDGTWLSRPELQDLSESLDETETSTHFLLGEPGCGKSSLLVRLAQEKHAAGWAVLAIKADRLPSETNDREALNRYLNLGADSAAVLRHLAQREPVLVVIDQLDALADLVVQKSARLRVLLDFVQDLSDAPGVRTVISCRTFEQKHDPALRNLAATELKLDLPDWSVVLPVLVSKGFRADAWNQDLQQVLRSPHALDVFLSSLEGATEPAALKSFHGLLEQQWTLQVLSDNSGKRRNTLKHLAKLMAEREVLGLPMAIVEDHFAEIQTLAAAGLLRVEQDSGRVEFRHQTLYEFIRARSFLEESGSLTETVRSRQGSLRIRPQLWHALGYFRSASPEEYGLEISKLWGADLRPHLKMLLIEFLGRQTTPMAVEQRLVEQAITDDWFLPRFIGATVGSPGWFSILVSTHLAKLMVSTDDKAQILLPLLSQALHFDANAVIELVRRYWLPNPSRDLLSWQVLGLGEVVPQVGPWLDSLIQIAGRTPISEWAIGHLTGVVSEAFPDEAPKIVAAWLKRQIQSIKDSLSPQFSGSEPAAAKVSRSVQSILETQQFYEMEAVAQAAPKAFILLIWPLLVEGLTLCTSDSSGVVLGYQQSRGLAFQELNEEKSQYKRPLLHSVELALRAWAELDAASYLDFADVENGSSLLLVHRFLSIGRVYAAADDPLRVLNYLVADPRRLVLGPYSDVHKESIDLIAAVSPLLDQVSFSRLEATLCDWTYYTDSAHADDDASVRQLRVQWSRQHRLRLLRALPVSRRSPALQKLIDEEERAFPGLQGHDIHSSGPQWIGSPVSAEQMDKGTDADVLNLFSELTDESAWDHPRHRMQGGAIQAGRELASLAQRNLDKALRIVRELKPGVNEIPVASVLRELVPAGLPVPELYVLVEELEDKGFISAGFRHDAAYAIAGAANIKFPVHVTLIDRMERWLIPQALTSSDEAQDDTNDSHSVLWGNGLVTTLPDGNYPTLSALTAACLASELPRIECWLDILERHADRTESPKMWEALLHGELLNLRLAERSRAESLVDKLVVKIPAILSGYGWVHFLANANHWASSITIERWIMRTLESAPVNQGAGELIGLRHALYPAEEWSRDLAYSYAESDSPIVVGLAHSVANLWHELITRPVVHPLLLQLIRSSDEVVLTALSAVFPRDVFITDTETQEFLDSLVSHPEILKTGRAEQLPELLAKLVVTQPQIVCRVVNVLIDAAGDHMGNMATSWYLSTEWLLDIALQLQDMGDAERAAGSTLFERMLEFNMPQAKEMTLNLDRRTPAGSQRPPIRRRTRLKTNGGGTR